MQPRAMRCCRLTALGESEDGKAVTKLQYAGWLEVTCHMPRWFCHQVIVPDQLQTPHALLDKFDGAFIASRLMDIAFASKSDLRACVVARFVIETRILRNCVFKQLGALLGTLVMGQRAVNIISLAQAYSVSARRASARDLSTITEEEAIAMGYAFHVILLTASTPADALDTFLTRYPFLREVDAFSPWFKPMMEVVTRRLMVSSRMGMGIRVTIGALLSTLDVGSDIYMVVSLFAIDRRFAALGTLSMVLTTLGLQIIVTIVQWKHRGWRKVALEAAIVLTFFKPLVDAYRVASGDPGDPFAPFTPAQELMVCRVCEMACEAIPVSLLQSTTYLLMADDERQVAAIVSILISCLATAFTTASMGYEMDTDPSKRKSLSQFYGWIPSTGRGRIAAILMLVGFHCGVVLGHAFGMALLAATHWMWLVAYLCTELAVYLFVKAVILRDLNWFVRGMGFGLSLVVRVIEKVTNML
jgi:hypothetical protein